MSGTTSCRPCAEPGGVWTGPVGVWLKLVSAIEHACRLGCRIFDMGQTGGVSGLEHVKRRFGGVVHPTPEVAWEGLPLSSLGRGFVALRRTVERGSLALHQRRAGNGHEL